MDKDANGGKVGQGRGMLLRRAVPVAVVIVASLLFSLFVLRLGFVNGESMADTLHSGQPVLIWQPGYRPVSGDVVVTNAANPLAQSLTKRVVACEGQRLQIRGGQVYVDGVLLAEPYCAPGAQTAPDMDCTVPPGHCFLMGDNRASSVDSREIGPVANADILGKVVWPRTSG